MPRYYFNVQDGVSTPDWQGTDLPDWDTARQEAIHRAGKILDDQAHRMELGEVWFMEVTDEQGLILFRLDFHVTGSPALRHDLARRGKLV